MEKQFFFLDGKEQKGPFTPDQLKSIGLKPETLVWTEGFDIWKPLKDVPELSAQTMKTPPPPPPIFDETNSKSVSSTNKNGNFWAGFKFVSALLLSLGIATLVVFYLLNSKKAKQEEDIASKIDKIFEGKTALLDGVLELADGVFEETGYKGIINPESEDLWEKDGLYTIFESTSGGFTVKKLTRLNDEGFSIETYYSGDMGFKKPEYSYHSPRYIDDFMGGKIQMDEGYKKKIDRLPVRKCFTLAFEYFTREDKKFPGAYKPGKYADISTFPELSNDFYYLENTKPKRVSSAGNNLASWSTTDIDESIDNEDWVVYYFTEGKHYELTLDKKAVQKDFLKNLGIAYGIVILIFLMTMAFVKR